MATTNDLPLSPSDSLEALGARFRRLLNHTYVISSQMDVTLRQQQEDIKSKEGEIDKVNIILQEQRTTLEDQDVRIKKLIEEKKNLEIQKESLQQNLNLMKDSHTQQNQSKDDEISKLRGAISVLEDKLRMMPKQTLPQDKNSRIRYQENEIAKLSKDHENAPSCIIESDEHGAEKTRRIKCLKTDLSTARIESDDLRLQISTLETENDRLQCLQGTVIGSTQSLHQPSHRSKRKRADRSRSGTHSPGRYGIRFPFDKHRRIISPQRRRDSPTPADSIPLGRDRHADTSSNGLRLNYNRLLMTSLISVIDATHGQFESMPVTTIASGVCRAAREQEAAMKLANKAAQQGTCIRHLLDDNKDSSRECTDSGLFEACGKCVLERVPCVRFLWQHVYEPEKSMELDVPMMLVVMPLPAGMRKGNQPEDYGFWIRSGVSYSDGRKIGIMA